MDLEQILSFLRPAIETMAGRYGALLQVLVVMASLRVVFKPLMLLADSLVLVIPGTKDNEFLAKVKAHKAYRMFSFFVDFFASVKLPKK